MKKRIMPAVLIPLLLGVIASNVSGQTEDPSTQSILQLYDAYLSEDENSRGPTSYNMYFPEAGDYVMYLQTEFPVDVEILLPGRRSFRHRATELAGNLIPLDVGGEGTATLTFNVADDSMETVYARSDASIFYLVVPAERVPAGRDIAVDMSGSRVDADGYFYASAYLFDAPDRTVTYDFVADDPEGALNIFVGNEVSFTAIPNARSDAPEIMGTEYTSFGGRQAVLVLIDSFNSEVVPEPFTLEVNEVDRYTRPPTVLSVGTPEIGVIDEQSPAITGRSTERFVLPVDRYQELGVLVSSDEIDTFVTVYTPSEIALTDDDGAEGTDSLLMLMADEEGTYSIYVSSYGGDEQGAFEILVLPAEEAFEYAGSGPGSELSPMPPPETGR
mgnify:CR=1 FL=1